MIGRTVKVGMFPCFEVLNFRRDDVAFLRGVGGGHFGERTRKNRTTFICDCEQDENRYWRTTTNYRIAESVPSCNYCAATIVARSLPTTVKGENQPSGLARNQE